MSNVFHEEKASIDPYKNSSEIDNKKAELRAKSDLLLWSSQHKVDMEIVKSGEEEEMFLKIIPTDQEKSEAVRISLGNADSFSGIDPQSYYADENLILYGKTDCYHDEYLSALFKDDKGVWHEQYSAKNLMLSLGSEVYSEENSPTDMEIHQYITALKGKGHLIDGSGHIYYKEADGQAVDTGFKRKLQRSHLDAAEIFDDSFTIMEFADRGGDPYGKANVLKNTLYKRQEDGSYQSILETDGKAIQKADFADNVYFVGGSIRHPEREDFFIDGQSSPSVVKECEKLCHKSTETELSKDRIRAMKMNAQSR